MMKNWVFLGEKRVESRNFASSRVESAKKGLDSSRVESSQDSYPSLEGIDLHCTHPGSGMGSAVW